MFLEMCKCLLVNTKKVYCFPFLNFFTWDLHVMFLEIYKGLFVNNFFLYLRFTCDVLGPVQVFTCEHKKKLLLTCLKHPYLRFTCVVFGCSLEHLYMRFTCVGDDPGPLQMFTCEQEDFFKVPWNLFTWDLHVMILNMYRCLLVSRNNILWFFKTFLQTSALGLCKTNCIKVWGKKTVCWHCQFWLHHTMNFICPYCCPKVWESLESNSNLSSQTPRV